MRISGALAALLLTLTSSASAAPIQGVIDAQTGFVSFRGLTGEIAFGLELPAKFAVLPPQPGILTYEVYPFPSQDARFLYFGLAGINGTFDFGNIVKPYLRQADFATFRALNQKSFVSEIEKFPPSFVSHSSAIPAGQAGLFVIIPEPASLTLLVLMMGILLTALRLQGSRQHCPAACRGC